jgi:hypothetical protein
MLFGTGVSRVDLACVVGLSGALVVLLHASGFPADHLAFDVHGAILPRFEEAGRAALAGRLPLWDPYEFCGQPLLASARGAMLYPPVVVLFALLNPVRALAGLTHFHLFLLVAGTFAYLRTLGIGWPAATCAAALVVGAVLSWGSDLFFPNVLGAVSWTPVLLLCFERAVGRADWRWVALLAIASALQWLAGFPDVPMDAAVLLMVVALMPGRGTVRRRIGMAAVGLVLGGMLAAMQLLPLAEMVAQGARTRDLNQIAFLRDKFGAFRPGELVPTFWRPLGVPLFALAAMGLGMGPRLAAGCAAAFVWCTFALHPPFSLLYVLPPYSGSRAPVGWDEMGGVFLACVAGIGLGLGCRRGARLGFACVLIAVLAIVGQARSVALRLASQSAYLRSVSTFEPAWNAEHAPTLHQLAERIDPGSRVIAERERQHGTFLRARLRSPDGYEPSDLEPRRIHELLRAIVDAPAVSLQNRVGPLAARPGLAALLGVGLVVAGPQDAPKLRGTGFTLLSALPGDDVALYRRPVPRARLVHAAVVLPDEATTLRRVVEHADDAQTTAVLAGPGTAPSLAKPPAGAAETVAIVGDEPEHIVVETHVESPALLVLTDTFYPGWTATVDGAAAPILRADHAFRAVTLEPGRHRVELVYRPWSVRLGFALSGLAAVGCLVLGTRRPRQRASR